MQFEHFSHAEDNDCIEKQKITQICLLLRNTNVKSIKE